mgnify:CR=1 FL=1
MNGAVGETPLVELDLGIGPDVYGKVEWFNAAGRDHGGGSIKTRIGRAMLDAAEASPDSIAEGKTILEASSGNTGTAVARFGAERGYDVEIVVPEHAGRGKVDAIRDAGASVHFVDGDRGYDGFVEVARRRYEDSPGRYYWPNQYQNPANPAVHAAMTGPELYRGTDGEVDHFVAGAGTGGTITGVAHALADRGVSVHGFEPASTDHDIAGLKRMSSPETFVPDTVEFEALDSRHAVETDAAHGYARRLRERHEATEIPIRDTGQWSVEAVREYLRVDGEFLVGPSSGGAAALVERLTRRGVIGTDETVVIPLADRGDRYPDRELWSAYL